MKEPVWIELPLVQAIHERLLAEHGGASGIRDRGLLDSALARPRQIFHYDDAANLTRLAAVYMVGVAKNHAFVDGNKRIAFMTGYVFLARNGLLLIASETEATETMLAVAAGSLNETELEEWLNKNTQPQKNHKR